MLIKPYKLQVPVIGRGGGMLGAEEWRGEGAPSRGRAKGQCGGGGGAAGAWWGGGWTICPNIFFLKNHKLNDLTFRGPIWANCPVTGEKCGTRLEKLILAVRQTGVSPHNGVQIKGPP